jgi:alkylation response protein AidB-like acyl-CoA dehydrogenase
MELVLNEEQKMLRDSAEKLIERHAGADAHRGQRDEGGGLDRDRLATIAEAGWFALMAPERAGGLDLGMTELALVAEQAGRGLLTEPVGALTVVARAIATGRAGRGLGDVLEAVMGGDQIILPLIRDDMMADDDLVTAMSEHHGYQLDGQRRNIPLADKADSFLLEARMTDGTILILVPRDAKGVHVEPADLVDGTSHGTVSFSATTIVHDKLVAGVRHGAALAADSYDRVLLALSAEMLGVMEKGLDLALEYLKTREQFGRPIGSFQALQHRAVNDYIEIELTRSLLYQACAAMDSGHGNRALAAAVKARASEAVLSVTKSTIQMHGAIGFTDEYDAGLYLRRAMVLANQYGTAAFHRRRFAQLSEELSGKDIRPGKRVKKKRRSVFQNP